MSNEFAESLDFSMGESNHDFDNSLSNSGTGGDFDKSFSESGGVTFTQSYDDKFLGSMDDEQKYLQSLDEYQTSNNFLQSGDEVDMYDMEDMEEEEAMEADDDLDDMNDDDIDIGLAKYRNEHQDKLLKRGENRNSYFESSSLRLEDSIEKSSLNPIKRQQLTGSIEAYSSVKAKSYSNERIPNMFDSDSASEDEEFDEDSDPAPISTTLAPTSVPISASILTSTKKNNKSNQLNLDERDSEDDMVLETGMDNENQLGTYIN